MNTDDLLRNAIFAGAIMLSNGAETYRVEDTILRILQTSEYIQAEAFVTGTGITASIETKESGLKTAIKRIESRKIHLGKVALVNDLSRRFVSGEVKLEKLHDELQIINASKPYPTYMRVFCVGIACGCFTYMFGGNITASLNAIVIAWISNSTVTYFSSKNVSSVLTNLIGSTLLTTLALISLNLNLNTEPYLDKVIIGAIMPMLPGIALTNAIRDILEGDFLSGTGRIMDAFLVAVSIATGVGVVFRIWMYLFS